MDTTVQPRTEPSDKRQVWVLGYFHHGNRGDDVFEHVFTRLTSSSTLEPIMINVDNLVQSVELLSDQLAHVHAVLVGGGDLINRYFLDQLQPVFAAARRAQCPVYAVGVGIPYPSMIADGALDAFDYIIHRTDAAHDALVHRYGLDHVHLAPDLAWNLLTANKKERTIDQSTRASRAHRQDVDRGWWGDWINQVQQVFSGGAPQPMRRIGVFLARPMRRPQHVQAYELIVSEMATFLLHVLQDTTTCGGNVGEIHLVAMGTGNSVDEDDRLMNRDVFHAMLRLADETFGHGGRERVLKRVQLLECPTEVDDIVPFFQRYHVTVCSRFHAHVFSLMAEVPLVSVSCTHKVRSLMHHAGLADDYLYELPVDPNTLHPIDCNWTLIMDKFQRAQKHHAQYRDRLRRYSMEQHQDASKTVTVLHNLLRFQPRAMSRFHLVHERLARLVYEHRLEAIKEHQVAHNGGNGKDKEEVTLDPKELLLSPGGVGRFLESDECTVDAARVARMISYVLTGAAVSDYTWGIEQSVDGADYDLGAACRWVLEQEFLVHHRLSSQFPAWKKWAPAPQMGTGGAGETLNGMGFDFEYSQAATAMASSDRVHRSGWPYVLDHLLPALHQPSDPSSPALTSHRSRSGVASSPVVFEHYLDATFGWRAQVLEDVGLLPIQRPWMGVLHHTPNETFSPNNLVSVFQRSSFQRSLNHCRGLVVLSEHVSTWIRCHLAKLGHASVPVHVLWHPTELDVPKFSMWRYWNALPGACRLLRPVVQVGGWLRNTYGIFALPERPESYHKYALQGRHMERYYLDECAFREYVHMVRHSLPGSSMTASGGCCGAGPVPSGDMSTGVVLDSPYVVGANAAMLSFLRDNHQSVTMLHCMDDASYDQLLASSVVFLNLVDASAVNTIIECIARHTPVVVNPLPAVVEYLGTGYPLYYRSLDEAADLLSNYSALARAHVYLRRLCKKNLDVNEFLRRFQTLEQ